MSKAIALICTVVISLLSSLAAAEERQGFTVGVGVGAGSLAVEGDAMETYVTPAASFHVGGALTPQLLLQADVEVTRAEIIDELAVQMNFLGISATGYLHPRFYLVGGLGVARMYAEDEHDGPFRHAGNSPGLLLGVGFEAYQSRHFALSVEARGVGARFEGTTVTGTNLLIGLQFF